MKGEEGGVYIEGWLPVRRQELVDSARGSDPGFRSHSTLVGSVVGLLTFVLNLALYQGLISGERQ